MPKKDEFTDLPRYVDEYTPEQQERVVRFYARLGLSELRRRQNINIQQQDAADEQHNDRAKTSLRANYDLLTAAIDRSEFGDLKGLRPKRKKRRDHRRE